MCPPLQPNGCGSTGSPVVVNKCIKTTIRERLRENVCMYRVAEMCLRVMRDWDGLGFCLFVRYCYKKR